MVPLRRVVQDSYEYHGLNELFFFFLFAIATNLVLYYHWTETTATFKSVVQESFSGYGNPDFFQVHMDNVDNMYDGVQYVVGFLEYHIDKADGIGYADDGLVRIGDYADILYARFLVNLENNCKLIPSDASCYHNDPEYNSTDSLAELGWQENRDLNFRQSTDSQSPWWSYTIIASHFNCSDRTTIEANKVVRLPERICREKGTRTAYIERLKQVTLNTATKWQEEIEDVNEWLLPFFGRYAYAFGVEILARNALEDERNQDTAVFSLQIQRADVPKEAPSRNVWQITTTNPMRLNSFYHYAITDWVRCGMEVFLVVLLVINTFLELWQFRLCVWQHNSVAKYFTYWWNIIQSLSTLCVYAWFTFYFILVAQLARKIWRLPVPYGDNQESLVALNRMNRFSSLYSVFLYGAIILNALICFRIMRYMRVHTGLKAFYQVFIIAAREFIDFGVFLLYILLLLGAAVFAFFQLSGGNPQFLRFQDGLSLMGRLTFGFLDYTEFNNLSLGLGTAYSAVTALFWFGVLLLVVYSQNIILAIVAEAYEEAKATLGTADTSFLVLVLQRIIFTGALIAAVFRIFVYHTCGWCVCNRPKDQPPDLLTLYDTYQQANTPSKGYRMGEQLRWRFASWAIVRTSGLKCLVNLYQDYATLKLNRRPTWPQAEPVAREVYSSISTETGTILEEEEEGVQMGLASSFLLPDLSSAGDALLARDDLTKLLTTVRKLGDMVDIKPNPFRGLRDRDIPVLVEALIEVYGIDTDGHTGSLVAGGQVQSNHGGELLSGSLSTKERRSGSGFWARMYTMRRESRDGDQGHGGDPTLKTIRNEQQRIERFIKDHASQQRSYLEALQSAVVSQQHQLHKLSSAMSSTPLAEGSHGVLHKTASIRRGLRPFHLAGLRASSPSGRERSPSPGPVGPSEGSEEKSYQDLGARLARQEEMIQQMLRMMQERK